MHRKTAVALHAPVERVSRIHREIDAQLIAIGVFWRSSPIGTSPSVMSSCCVILPSIWRTTDRPALFSAPCRWAGPKHQ
jgi:hypothetical protein